MGTLAEDLGVEQSARMMMFMEQKVIETNPTVNRFSMRYERGFAGCTLRLFVLSLLGELCETNARKALCHEENPANAQAADRPPGKV